MKITITIETADENVALNTASETQEPPCTIDGPGALVEHADHDSTPRPIGFTAQP